MKDRIDPQRFLLAIGAPFLAVVFAGLVSSVVLLFSGDAPLHVFKVMIDFGTQPQQVVNILNRSTTYYLSAVAVAIGFKMNLFNIGVDGQYRLAAFIAAAVAGAIHLPRPLHLTVVVLVAMAVGAMWAGIAGLLRTGRGVSEVISTIMLNFIAAGLIAYLLSPDKLAVRLDANNIGTKPIPPSGQMPGFSTSGGVIFGFIVVAVLVGIAYSVLLNRSRFGFDLRATGRSESAAVASGVSVKRMILISMLLSGAIAGLVGMPQLLGASHTFSLDFQSGAGFTGIAVALLGRNNPIGMAVGALLWSFLDISAQILDLESVPKEITIIMQGVIVLSVVIAYELVRRFGIAQEQRRVRARLSAATPVEVTA
ncbi:MAG: ABC transporter permease [Actinomycetes bacterium]